MNDNTVLFSPPTDKDDSLTETVFDEESELSESNLDNLPSKLKIDRMS